MSLDPATLGTVSIILSALMGVLLLFSACQNPRVTALRWWGGGFLIGACGVVILGLGKLAPHDDFRAVAIGNALLVLGVGSKYCGCRDFNGRPLRPYLAMIGAVVCLAGWALTFPDPVSFHLVAIVAGSYLVISAWELLKHAKVRLVSQLAASAVYLVAGLVCLNRGLLGPVLAFPSWVQVFANGWSSGWALLVLLYIPTTAVLLLTMAMEWLTYEARQSSLTDPLTLLPNRRAFFQDADALFHFRKDLPTSCLLFDLDNFKNVNDGFGHKAGDSILQRFAKILKEHATGPHGRIGGEEFAAIIEGDKQTAERVGDAVRVKFSQDSIDVGMDLLRVTVSVGCATAIGLTTDELLALADNALYMAKARGRNRLVSAGAGGERPQRTGSPVFGKRFSTRVPDAHGSDLL